MNWPFEIKYPVAVSSDDWVRDFEGRTIIEAHMADELNRLHAEVERLKAEKELTSPFLNAARIFALILQDADRSMESRRAVQSRFVELSNEYAAAIKEAQE